MKKDDDRIISSVSLEIGRLSVAKVQPFCRKRKNSARLTLRPLVGRELGNVTSHSASCQKRKNSARLALSYLVGHELGNVTSHSASYPKRKNSARLALSWA